MGWLFSSEKLGFYNSADSELYIAAGSWPTDLVEVTEDVYSIYAGVGIPAGKMLGCEAGMPAWVDLPPKTTDELAADAQSKRSTALAVATEKIAPLQDAVDLGVATEAETTSLTKWKTYRVLVNRVPTQPGFPTAIDWPSMPE